MICTGTNPTRNLNMVFRLLIFVFIYTITITLRLHAINETTNKQTVILLLQDTLKEWGFLQVMTQVIGQELYQATLHPLPTGSRIMGGQGKE
jgi:putative ribosome biogenesis GTPase RsgA